MLKRTLIALSLLTAAPCLAQPGPPYGGFPMWERDPRFDPPARRPYPQVDPCIIRGECAGPPREEGEGYQLPPRIRRVPLPRRYRDWEED